MARLDASASLMYYGARYYDTAIGRFIQPDSLIDDVYNPQSLNRYSYVHNNPVRYTDPTGHSVDCGDDCGTSSSSTTMDPPASTGENQGTQSYNGSSDSSDHSQGSNPSTPGRGPYQGDYNELNVPGEPPICGGEMGTRGCGGGGHPGGGLGEGGAVEPAGEEILGVGPGGIRLYRGGNSFDLKPGDVRVDKQTDLVKTDRGVSLSSNPVEMEERFGSAYELTSVPEGLYTKQVGKNPEHYEMPPQMPISVKDYQSLLKQAEQLLRRWTR